MNIERRIGVHFYDLARQRHCCAELQAAFNLYSTEYFHWKILEKCALDRLNEREYYQMAIWPGKLYNTAPARLRKAQKKPLERKRRATKMSRTKTRKTRHA
jgi:hypothetical protein